MRTFNDITMKFTVITVALLAFWLPRAGAQLTVQNGATITTLGGATIVLQDIDLQCDGTINQQAFSGVYIFNGSHPSVLSGSGVPLFDWLQIAKSGGAVLQLQQSIHIGSALFFNGGFIDPNGNTIQLNADVTTAPPAFLLSESDTSRIFGPTGGSVAVSSNAAVVSPDSLNVGSIGVSITSAANLGNLSVSRMNVAASNPSAPALTGIQRSFFIQPQNNTALNATLRFYYLDAELNGRDPGSLSLWKSTDGVNWANVGADALDLNKRFVQKSGIADFSYWTLTDVSNPLPVTLLSFQAICEAGAARLQWQSSAETDAADYIIEKTEDGRNWMDLATVPAQNDPLGASYSYMDNSPSPAAFYRLKMQDRDGHFTYSPVFGGGCAVAAMPFVVYPNPVHDVAAARLSVRAATRARLSLLDLSGKLIGRYDWSLQPGVNTFLLPHLASLAAGTYLVDVEFGGSRVQTQFVKQ
jgi:hypothetical protein